MADARQISEMLARRAEDVARLLFPNGRKSGAEWRVGGVNGEEGQSLGVHLSGRKAGVWADFASGESGDLLDLYRAVKGVDLVTALDWARDYLGVSRERVRPMGGATYRKPQRPASCVKPVEGVLRYLTEVRKLKPATVTAFQIGELPEMAFGVNGHSVTFPAIVFPFKVEGELRFVKYLAVERPEGRKITKVEAKCEPVLFGWQAIESTHRDARAAVICEGEVNALSWFEYGYPALATPFGAGNGHKHDWIDSEWERLERFSLLYLDFDEDDAGRKAVDELARRLGAHRCKIVPPKPGGRKDINDCLKDGVAAEEIRALIESAKFQEPRELATLQDFRAEIVERIHPPKDKPQGIPLPITTNADGFSLRPGELSIWAGYNGHRKSQLVFQTAQEAAAFYDHRVLFAELEMPIDALGERLMRAALTMSRPGVREIDEYLAWAHGKLWVYNAIGKLKIKRFLEVLDYAIDRHGIGLAVVDSLSRFTKYDDYAEQFDVASEMQTFAVQKRAHIALIHHVMKTDTEDAIPHKLAVRGAGGIVDATDSLLIVWKNTIKARALQKAKNTFEKLTRAEEEAVSGPDGLLILEKDRNGKDEPRRMPYYCNPTSLTFQDVADTPARRLICAETDDEKEIVF